MFQKETTWHDLPKDIKEHIATYLNTSSLSFFAVVNRENLQMILPLLIQRQKTLLHPPYPGIVAGLWRTAIYMPHALYICGSNGDGQLGLGHTNNKYDSFTKVKKPPGEIQQIAAGHNHTLVLTDQGLYGCGSDEAGQLGLGIDYKANGCPDHKHLSFIKIGTLPGKIQQVVAGSNQTFALTDQGLYVCGSNGYGQLGLGLKHANITEEDYCVNIFTKVEKLPGKVLQIVSGENNTWLLTDQGLYACGFNAYGELGLGHKNKCHHFTKIEGLPGTIQQITCGEYHTLIFTDEGLYASGSNKYGQLGLGHTYDRCRFIRIEYLPGTIQQIASGCSHTVVLTDQGLYVCGENKYAQLGLGHTNDCSHFTKVENLAGTILQIAAGYYHTLVLTDQKLYACGTMHFPHCGSSLDNIFVPVHLPPRIKQLFSLYQRIEQLKKVTKIHEDKDNKPVEHINKHRRLNTP